MTSNEATPEEVRRAQRVAELRARVGNPQGWVSPPTPESGQILRRANTPLDLLNEARLRELAAVMRRNPDPALNRDDTLEQLRMIAFQEQSVVRAYGKRIASQANLIKFVSPHSYEQWTENKKVCGKLRNPERPGFNCKDCRRETYEEFRLCHLYPLYDTHPEVRPFLKR